MKDSDLKKLIEQFSRLSKEHIDLQSQHEKVLEVLKEERARLTLDDIPMKGVWKVYNLCVHVSLRVFWGFVVVFLFVFYFYRCF